MRHQKKDKILSRKAAPKKALLRSLATHFVIYEKIKTTDAKARVLKPMVEKIITLGKTDTLHNRRQVLKILYLQGATKKVFEVLGPKYKTRQGGYTRLVKLNRRAGDNAQMAILELVEQK